jgi:8-hydroxy-5-deazaflavin:NADPH oxidoreductase
MGGLRIGVLGAGNIGGTLSKKWVAAGHTVACGVTDPQGQRAQALRADLGDQVTIGTAADALAGAEVVLMAVPGGAMDAAIAANAAHLDGKIVIDAANRMGGGGPANSFATFQQQTPNARLYRAFNTYGWDVFADPTFAGGTPDHFYCGPDGPSRAIVERLISDVGVNPIWLGGPEQVGVVDGLLPLWLGLAAGQKMGRHLAFKLLR